MKQKDELELYYIFPYTKSYNNASDVEYVVNNSSCESDYRIISEGEWNNNSRFFEDKDELLKWFCRNSNQPIPQIYRIKYIANYKGLDDVFKITDLSDGETKYYTALNENEIVSYDALKSEFLGKYVWDYSYVPNQKNRFVLKDIYKEFCKRGIKIKYNIYEKTQEQDIDKKECFEFIGNPYNQLGQKEIKSKKLILLNSWVKC